MSKPKVSRVRGRIPIRVTLPPVVRTLLGEAATRLATTEGHLVEESLMLNPRITSKALTLKEIKSTTAS